MKFFRERERERETHTHRDSWSSLWGLLLLLLVYSQSELQHDIESSRKSQAKCRRYSSREQSEDSIWVNTTTSPPYRDATCQGNRTQEPMSPPECTSTRLGALLSKHAPSWKPCQPTAYRISRFWPCILHSHPHRQRTGPWKNDQTLEARATLFATWLSCNRYMHQSLASLSSGVGIMMLSLFLMSVATGDNFHQCSNLCTKSLAGYIRAASTYLEDVTHQTIPLMSTKLCTQSLQKS